MRTRTKTARYRCGCLRSVTERWRSFGWSVDEVDGHDVSALHPLLQKLASRPEPSQPALVIAHTVKGKGIPYMESHPGWHLGYLGAEDEQAALDQLR